MDLLDLFYIFIVMSLVTTYAAVKLLMSDRVSCYSQAVDYVETLNIDCNEDQKLKLTDLYYKWLVTEDMEYKYKFNDLFNTILEV